MKPEDLVANEKMDKFLDPLRRKKNRAIKRKKQDI
jgi:hypothetical protein